ncbi:MAG: hypothetical protein M3158_12005, partial [Pseudomonadota bacterium]|nr:hypothetical protein [Pseudomonadota bacterium]
VTRSAHAAPSPAPGVSSMARAPASDDRATLRALFSDAMTAPAPLRGSVTVAPARAQGSGPAGVTLAAGTTVKVGFSSTGDDLPVGRFGGPAVKAVPVLR